MITGAARRRLKEDPETRGARSRPRSPSAPGRDGFVEPRTVDVHLARLRAKCISARVSAPAIETVRGVGYRFKDPGDS